MFVASPLVCLASCHSTHVWGRGGTRRKTRCLLKYIAQQLFTSTSDKNKAIDCLSVVKLVCKYTVQLKTKLVISIQLQCVGLSGAMLRSLFLQHQKVEILFLPEVKVEICWAIKNAVCLQSPLKACLTTPF
jgi:hypothetical protein